jgi:hypothetical protein
MTPFWYEPGTAGIGKDALVVGAVGSDDLITDVIQHIARRVHAHGRQQSEAEAQHIESADDPIAPGCSNQHGQDRRRQESRPRSQPQALDSRT